MEALKGLFSPKRGPLVPFRAMSESRNLIDSQAEQVDTQLIVHTDGVALRDREPVTLYRLQDHDSVPVWHYPLIVETGLFRRPEVRSRWTLQESHHIWQGYASGTLKAAKAKLSFDPKSMRGISLFAGISVFLICIVAAIVLSAVGGADQPMQHTETPGANDHGFVDPAEGAQEGNSSEATGGDDRGGGGAAPPQDAGEKGTDPGAGGGPQP